MKFKNEHYSPSSASVLLAATVLGVGLIVLVARAPQVIAPIIVLSGVSLLVIFFAATTYAFFRDSQPKSDPHDIHDDDQFYLGEDGELIPVDEAERDQFEPTPGSSDH
jgi:hypothetical protein